MLEKMSGVRQKPSLLLTLNQALSNYGARKTRKCRRSGKALPKMDSAHNHKPDFFSVSM